MGKISYFIFAVLLIAGCSKDDNANNSDNDVQGACGIPNTETPDTFLVGDIGGGDDEYSTQPYSDSNRPLKDIGTSTVNNYFFTNPESLFNFFSAVYGKINIALAQYRTAHSLPDDSIFLTFKGGNVLRMLANRYFELLPSAYRAFIQPKYASYFQRSDADFSVYINDSLPNYDAILNDVTSLVFKTLDDIRDLFLAHPTTYFDFLKLPTIEADSILANALASAQKTDIFNDITNERWWGAELLQLVMPNGRSQPSPQCPYIGQYDFSFETVPKSQTQVLAHRLNDTRSWIFNSDNRTLTWPSSSDPTQFIKFYLLRSKVAFEYIYKQGGSLQNRTIGGELIDVSIPVKGDSQTKGFFDHLNTSIHDYTLSFSEKATSIAFKSYTASYLAHDLETILFTDFERPWSAGKYEKRLYRLFFLYIMNLIENSHSAVLNQNYLTQVNGLVETMKGLYIAPSSTNALATFHQQVTTLVNTWPNYTMNRFWKACDFLINSLFNSPQEGDENSYQNFLGFIEDNLKNARTLANGSLSGTPNFAEEEVYTLTMDDYF